MTPAQLATLKAAILADNALASKPLTSAAALEIALALNLAASPDYWVWRTDVSRLDVYNNVDWEGNFWNWTTYKNQGATEQNAWVQMFMGDRADFSQANLRAGIAAIFAGSGVANAQRDHCLSIGRRKALRIEKILASGTGSSASPAVMGFEGQCSSDDVQQARELP